jgi:two-component system chemotaxis response regulator CheY
MKILVVEDDFTSRLLLQKLLAPYGEVHIAINGREAMAAFRMAREESAPYQLICLDIVIPDLDGQAVLQEIRHLEEAEGIVRGNGVKIIMTTVVQDPLTIMNAFTHQCEAYLVKPIDKGKLVETLHRLGIYLPK